MNFIACAFWFLLNLFFGAIPSSILFYWIACDMQMPLIVKNFASTYLPIYHTLLDVPYAQVNELSTSVIAKLIFNALLYTIFGFAHTFFAQEYVQARLNQFLFPKQTLRTVYCVMITVTVFIVIGFWQHTHIQLWNWLPPTMNIYQQQLVLLVIYNVIYAPSDYVSTLLYRL